MGNNLVLQIELWMDKAESFLIVKGFDISGIVPPSLRVKNSWFDIQYYTKYKVSSFLEGHET